MAEDRDPKQRIIGVDLGMTSVISAIVASPGQPPQVIPQERGHPGLASVVSFQNPSEPIIGRAARDMITTAPAHTVTGIKRLLGRKASSQAVRDLNVRVGYEIVEGEEGDAAIKIGERLISPEHVAALLLQRVKQFAETHLNAPVDRCVVAVPAYFTKVQKTAVRRAGEAAGLKVAKLVHEPTAVALAYGYNKSDDSRVVIIDMGGVRLDISVMEITGNVFDVVATGGDAYLGGANLDARLAEWILASIKEKFDRDLRESPALLLKVRTAAEQAKRESTRHKAVDLQIPLSTDADSKEKTAGLRLNRATVDQLANDLVLRVVGLVRHVLESRGLDPSQIDDVLLVGGATRMLSLREKLGAYFGKELRSSVPPEQAIALGAALLADSLSRQTTSEKTNDVAVDPIGIALSDGRYMRIIDKDSRLPITRRVMIPTVRDNQRTIELDLFQGDHEELLETDYLGTIVFPAIPDAKAGDAKLVVDLILDKNMKLCVTSPEDGRTDERFEFLTRGHTNRNDDDPPSPLFEVAQNPGEKSQSSQQDPTQSE